MKQKKAKTELKPCPHCGAPAILRKRGKEFVVSCSRQTPCGSQVAYNECDAVQAWNDFDLAREVRQAALTNCGREDWEDEQEAD